MYTWDVIGVRYTCYDPTISGSGDTITAVIGGHKIRKGNDQVECLAVYGQHMNSLPTNMDQYFKNLVGISIDLSWLFSISAEDLQPFPGLMYFRSHSNYLESIDGDLFKHTRNLKLVSMYNSQLEYVGYDLLTGLKDLVVADFTFNPCINTFANTSESIAELKRDLSIHCPPLNATVATVSTTPEIALTTNDFSATPCTELIHEVKAKTLKLSKHIDVQDREISNLSAESRQLRKKLDDQSERIGYLEYKTVEFSDENATQKQEVVELKIENVQQKATNSMLLQVNAMFEARIVELEAQMRELTSRPCSTL